MSNETQTRARPLWDWRIAGIALGSLMAFSTAVFKPLGVSTSYCTSWGMVLSAVAPEWAKNHPYLKLVGTSVTGEWMLVVGLILGAWFAARLSRSSVHAAIPVMWSERFGSSRLLRFGIAGLGGFLFLFGARLAGGCTSGHVLSGLSQLALSSAVFAVGVFTTGIFTAKLLYRRAR